MVKLIDGRQVCDFCPEWKTECEARDLLQTPLDARRKALAEREKVRGKESVDNLRAVMTAVHAAKKAGAK